MLSNEKEELLNEMQVYLKELKLKRHDIVDGKNNLPNWNKWEKFERFVKQYNSKTDFNIYHVRAKFFLYKTDTDLKIVFTHKGKYFPDDKDERNIYTFVLTRKGKIYSSTFGDSLDNTRRGEVPSEYSILACLEKYHIADFTEFCAMYGYDEDSRKAYKIYEEVKKQSDIIIEMFADCIDELREIQ